MTPEFKDAFLCHNRADKNWVRRLGERLEAETIDGLPTSRQLKVFFDEWDIDYGENILNKINAGLAAARNVVVVMSPELFASAWTNLEWTDVVAEDPWGTTGKIIPVLVRDVSLDGSQRISFPTDKFHFMTVKLAHQWNQQLTRTIRSLNEILVGHNVRISYRFRS